MSKSEFLSSIHHSHILMLVEFVKNSRFRESIRENLNVSLSRFNDFYIHSNQNYGIYQNTVAMGIHGSKIYETLSDEYKIRYTAKDGHRKKIFVIPSMCDDSSGNNPFIQVNEMLNEMFLRELESLDVLCELRKFRAVDCNRESSRALGRSRKIKSLTE